MYAYYIRLVDHRRPSRLKVKFEGLVARLDVPVVITANHFLPRAVNLGPGMIQNTGPTGKALLRIGISRRWKTLVHVPIRVAIREQDACQG
jgi:hypothetical protein